MLKKMFSEFGMELDSPIVLIAFVLLFLLWIGKIYKKSSKSHFETLSHLPFNEMNEIDEEVDHVSKGK